MSIHDEWSSEKASDWTVTPSKVKLQAVKKADITKSMEDSRAVLFIGLKIDGAEPLAIEGGENHEDFHVTLAYGHFDAKGDEDDTSVRVQHAIADIRDLSRFWTSLQEALGTKISMSTAYHPQSDG